MCPSCVPRKLHSLIPFVHVAFGLLRFCLVVSQLHPVQASVGRSCHSSIPGLLPQETMTPAGPRAQAAWLCFCPWPCVCSLFCSWEMQRPGSCGQLGPTLPGLCCFLHFVCSVGSVCTLSLAKTFPSASESFPCHTSVRGAKQVCGGR